MGCKIIYKRLGYWQVDEIPDLGSFTLDFVIQMAKLIKLNGAEIVHITR